MHVKSSDPPQKTGSLPPEKGKLRDKSNGLKIAEREGLHRLRLALRGRHYVPASHVLAKTNKLFTSAGQIKAGLGVGLTFLSYRASSIQIEG